MFNILMRSVPLKRELLGSLAPLCCLKPMLPIGPRPNYRLTQLRFFSASTAFQNQEGNEKHHIGINQSGNQGSSRGNDLSNSQGGSQSIGSNDGNQPSNFGTSNGYHPKKIINDLRNRDLRVSMQEQVKKHFLPAPHQQMKLPATLDYHLNQVNSRWDRMKVRMRWALIRSHRPFNTDDIGAMFSWIIWGHILWIILGTTTFISLVVWFMSQFRLEDVFARWVGRLVTKETGLRVVFEQAIVPDWKSGCIVLNKVFMQRRPGAARKVATGSQELARTPNTQYSTPTDDGNYTQFDLTVDTISVTLSVKRWLSGRGILQTVEARGIRGVLDRRHLKQAPPDYDPTKDRKKHNRGDFDWENVKIDDLMVTVLQPNHNPSLPPVPPFQVSLFSCELPRLRKQWLLYDFLNCNYLSGSFDDSMFSMHTRQMPTNNSLNGPTNLKIKLPHHHHSHGHSHSHSSNDSNETINKVQRFRIDDVDIRHLNRGVTGMFGWIESGTCDFLADIMLPPAEAELTVSEKTFDLFERWEAQIKNIWSHNKQHSHEMITSVERDVHAREAQKTVAIDLRMQFNNPRASAPLYSRSLNYINNAIIHPVVAYINSRDTYIPVHCSVVKRLSDFEGSWTVYDSGLMGAISSELYQAFARNAQDDEARSRRIKKVGFWSLQFMAQLVLLTLGIVA